ncbi:MAG TPA: DNA recombination protein RmuC [Acidobacteriaceae bacterium]|nr:DNA recombination protein RmuC [Acidobacteriaceae bacterium]
MLAALLALQALTLLVLAVLFFRRPAQAATDPRLETLLAADLPRQLTFSEARADGVERLLRSELAQLRQDSAEAAVLLQDAHGRSAEALRSELLRNLGALGETLRGGLDSFRGDHKGEAERLRAAVDVQLAGLNQRLLTFTADANKHQSDSRDALHARLNEISKTQGEHQERLRSTVEARLDKLNEANTLKLEEMRATVDEKLHATLQTRLTESFGAVTDQLTKVHTGLGEMTKLSAGVDDLSRIFTNVKSRGGFAEVQLGMLLSQMLAPAQFSQNVKVKPNTGEMVEFAVKLPTPNGEVLLPIDAKFPREAWERLETAYAEGTAVEIAGAGKAFENAIRTEGKRICEKYIAPPATTNFAIMFLPTEGLYAEVMRRDGLQADIQQNCRVTIAGPSTLSAILNSFQMGFHMLQLQQKGDEVWKVLAAARTQFGKFEDLMSKMDDQVSKVQKTIQEVGTRTRVINRTLRDVSLDEAEPRLANGNGHHRNGYDGLLPMLVASEE